MLAALRPDAWNLPLFVHVLGAMVLVGALVTVAGALLLGWSRDTAALTRFGFRMLLLAGVPAYLVMRISAEWVLSEEDVPGDPAWIVIGYIATDLGLLLLIIATVLAGLGARKLRRDPAAATSGLARAAAVLVLIMVVADLVAVWAMATKPA